MQRLVEDLQDPGSQKVAVMFLSRCVVFWGQPDLPANQSLPGFELFIYKRLVPTAFRVPSLPNFNLKDGQVTVVSSILLVRVRHLNPIVSSGSAWNCQPSPNHLQDERGRSLQLLFERFSSIAKLAYRNGAGFHHKIARLRWQKLPKILHRLDSIFSSTIV